MTIQMVQTEAIGAMIFPVEGVEGDSGVIMNLVEVTSRIMEEDLLGVALEVVVVEDQFHIQVCYIFFYWRSLVYT
jgi:hypothetical protein